MLLYTIQMAETPVHISVNGLKFLLIQYKHCISIFKNELTSYVVHWVFEDSLEYLLIACNGEISPRIENVLFKTFPNNTWIGSLKHS